MTAGAGARSRVVTLLERTRELLELDDVIEAAAAGNGRLVVIEGPAGIGKTALVESAGKRARGQALRVLIGRACQLESSFSYGIVRQWLEGEWLRARGDGAAEHAAALVLSPQLRPVPAGEDASFGILHGLYWFVADLAQERPLVLLLDDAQWADMESLWFLSYLQWRLDGLAVGVVVAARVGEGGAPERLVAARRSRLSSRRLFWISSVPSRRAVSSKRRRRTSTRPKAICEGFCRPRSCRMPTSTRRRSTSARGCSPTVPPTRRPAPAVVRSPSNTH